MKSLPTLIGLSTLLVTTAIAATKAPPTVPSRPPIAAPVAVPLPPLPPNSLKLDDYINDLASTLKLSDADKKEVEDLYVADGDNLKKILNDDSLSPLEQAQQVSDLRDTRNTKIEGLLHDVDARKSFRKIEAKYRVALTLSAADGGLVAAPPPPAAAPAAPAAPLPVTAPETPNAAGKTTGK